jgi:thioester reductase-like protein
MKPYTSLEDFQADFTLQLPTGATPLVAPRHLLLTGASGFLGRYVLLDVLERTSWRVTCLVRAKSKGAAADKLLRSMKRAGWQADALPARVDAVCGDIEAERLGFSPEDYERLVHEVDSVAHGAAQIAWAKPYAMLRETNVFGAREMARFCATGRLKRLVFVSSIATRYSHVVEGPIDEDTDMRGVVHRMALGYGQSKTVAESLVEELRTVGAPVTVIRPSFIGAHSVTGVLNDDDFIARMLVTMAAERIAPTMHLWLDAVAVDEAAAVVRACVAEDPAANAPRRLNLQSPEPPYFGEVFARAPAPWPGSPGLCTSIARPRARGIRCTRFAPSCLGAPLGTRHCARPTCTTRAGSRTLIRAPRTRGWPNASFRSPSKTAPRSSWRSPTWPGGGA